MQKVILSYSEGTGRGILYNTIPIEAADLETCKQAANQWRVNEKRLKGRVITILNIEPVNYAEYWGLTIYPNKVDAEKESARFPGSYVQRDWYNDDIYFIIFNDGEQMMQHAYDQLKSQGTI